MNCNEVPPVVLKLIHPDKTEQIFEKLKLTHYHQIYVMLDSKKFKNF